MSISNLLSKLHLRFKSSSWSADRFTPFRGHLLLNCLWWKEIVSCSLLAQSRSYLTSVILPASKSVIYVGICFDFATFFTFVTSLNTVKMRWMFGEKISFAQILEKTRNDRHHIPKKYNYYIPIQPLITVPGF